MNRFLVFCIYYPFKSPFRKMEIWATFLTMYALIYHFLHLLSIKSTVYQTWNNAYGNFEGNTDPKQVKMDFMPMHWANLSNLLMIYLFIDAYFYSHFLVSQMMSMFYYYSRKLHFQHFFWTEIGNSFVYKGERNYVQMILCVYKPHCQRN